MIYFLEQILVKLKKTIKYDDLDTFIKLSSEPKFDHHNYSYMQIMAYFGSIKCFKFLILNEATINEDLGMYVVCSGNGEMFHFSENNNILFDNIPLNWH